VLFVEIIVVIATEEIVQIYSVFVDFIEVTAKEDLVQFYCVCSCLLWLKQQ